MPIAVAYTRHFNTVGVATPSAGLASTAGTGYDATVSAAGAPTAPTAPFTSGVEVGVPSGTTLTTRTSLGTATGSQSYTITHPITGAQTTRTMSKWENLKFTQTFTISPPSGQTYLFKNCRWEVEETVWCVEVNDTNGVADQMQPVVVFDHCSFQGMGNSNIGVAGSFLWLIACDIEGMSAASPPSGTSDGWQGATYSVAVDSNIIAGTNADLADPHSDGIQNSGTGGITLYHCWISAGGSNGANAAVRCGTEFGAIEDVDVFYCTLDDGGYATQFRGDAAGGSSTITGVRFRGNRWTETAVYGPTDFELTTVDEWTDNKYLNGTTIPNPAP